MTRPGHDAVRDAIRDMGIAAERRVPGFDVVLARRAAPPPSLAPRLALAAAIVFAVAVLGRGLARDAGRLVVPGDVLALSAWRPATDALLPDSATLVTRLSPSIRASLIPLDTGDYR